MSYVIEGHIIYGEKPIRTLPPQNSDSGIKRNIRIYKNEIYDLEYQLSMLKWFNFMKKREIKYKINQYTRHLKYEENKLKGEKER